ncbi:MAG: hypothetical protein KDA92_26240 [Planctomycetales bacterium]|nr:hypothetical protein [Planctomycetales bacterium]MCA9170243.1 hypothetical protein [Planctomycetales bacterium]
MKSMVTLLSALLVAVLTISANAEDLKSGLQVGDSPGAFNVKDITGPNKGKSLCYRCSYGSRPVVSVFARDVNADLAKLVKEVDEIVGKNDDKKMAAFVVVLAEDADVVAPKLEAMAKENGIKNVPLTIYDGEAGPQDYKIAEGSDVTVMMWNKSKVKSNVALAKGKLDTKAIESIVSETDKILN